MFLTLSGNFLHFQCSLLKSKGVVFLENIIKTELDLKSLAPLAVTLVGVTKNKYNRFYEWKHYRF